MYPIVEILRGGVLWDSQICLNLCFSGKLESLEKVSEISRQKCSGMSEDISQRSQSCKDKTQSCLVETAASLKDVKPPFCSANTHTHTAEQSHCDHLLTDVGLSQLAAQ